MNCLQRTASEVLPPILLRLLKKALYLCISWKKKYQRRDEHTTPSLADGFNASSLVAPQGHMLVAFQRDHPLYDRYFLPFFEAENQRGNPIDVIDVGANIGDTARAILYASPESKVLAVEGSPSFLPYLRINTADFPQVGVLEAYVDVGLRGLVPDESHGTGKLVPSSDRSDDLAFVSVSAVIEKARLFSENSRRVVWKSDTDGHDIRILNQGWSQITSFCIGVWIEWAPFLAPDSFEDVLSVIERIQESGLICSVFDNFGRPVVRLSGPSCGQGLVDLTEFLRLQSRLKPRGFYYFDLWLLPEDETAALWDSVYAILPK